MKTNKLLIVMSALLIGGASLAPGGALEARAAEGDDYAYNASTDLYLDDLVGNDDRRSFSTTGAAHQSFGYLDVDLARNVVNNEASCDDSVYKIGTTGDQANATITLSIYLEGNVDISKIKIKVRGGANGTPDYPCETGFALNETINGDGETNSNIPMNEWTTVSINIPMTFAGVNIVQGSTSAPVSSGVSGFHLYNLSGNEGTLRLREVRIGQAVDDFINRPGSDLAYWYGTQGNLIDTSVYLEGGSYAFDYGSTIDYSNIGLELLGDLTGLSIAPISGGSVGTAVLYEDLVNYEGKALPTSLEGRSVVTVNLAASGISTPIEGIQLTSTTPLTVYGIFASDCIVEAPEILYPALDLSDVSYFNDFNVTYEGGHWPSAYGASGSDVLTAHAIDYAVAYTDDAQTAYLNGSSLVLPALADSSHYGNFFLGTDRHPAASDKDYMVVAARSLDAEGNPGTDFSSLRIVPDNQTTLWANAGYAGFGLRTIPTSGNYPYRDGNGFVYLIFDIDECGLNRSVLGQGITFYWGASTIEIDSIFFANRLEEEPSEPAALFEGLPATANAGAGYTYLNGALLPSDTLLYGDTLTLKIVNNGEAIENALESLRIQIAGGTYWWVENAQGTIRGLDGNTLSADLAAGENDFAISLSATGIENPAALAGTEMHFHYGNGSEPALDLVISAYTTPEHQTYEAPWNGGEVLNLNPMTGGDYNYLGGLGTGNVDFVGDILEFTIVNPGAETLAGVLDTVRLGIGSKTLWFSENAEGQLLDLTGNPFGTDLEPGANTYRIRLSSYGIDPYSLIGGVIHVHAGAGTASGLTLSAKFVRESLPESDMADLASDDYSAPEISIVADKDSYTVGDTVTLTVTVTDDVDTDPTVEVNVVYGSGDSAKTIEVDDNSFVASEAGVYTITVTASDEAGNATTATLQILVNEPSSEPGTSEPGTSDPDASEPATSEPGTSEPTTSEPTSPSEGSGLTDGELWAIIGGVIGGVVIVGVVTFLVVFYRKKKAEK